MTTQKIKRLICAFVAATMLFCALPMTAGAVSEVSEMLMRTDDIDHSWHEPSANQTVKIISDSSDSGIDSAVTEKPEGASAACIDNHMNTEATPQTIWMKNTNTWAFGYAVEVKGIKGSVTATVTSTSFGHDHTGKTGNNAGGWCVAGYNQSYVLTEDGVYYFFINGSQTQGKIQRPNRTYLMWVKQYDIRFSSNVSFRVLAEMEAVSDSDSTSEANFSSPATVNYYDRSGKVAKTQKYNTHGDYMYNSQKTPVISGVPFDYTLESYVEDGVTYEFIGWSLKANADEPDVSYIYGNMDVYPVFQATGVPFATLCSEDGSVVYKSKPILPGKGLVTDFVPTKESDEEHNYTFAYWKDEAGNRVDVTKLQNEITLYAYFEKTLKDLTVNIYSEDGNTLKDTKTVKYGTAFTPEAPAKNGDKDRNYIFEKWVTCEDGKDASLSSVTHSLNIRPVYTAQFINHYTDLLSNVWYSPYIEYAVLNGIMNGMSDTKFSPNTPTTRAMFVTVLYRLEGSRDVSGLKAVPFKDVPASSYYANAVRWAYNMGVVDGTSATAFSPNNNITREQMSTMLYRYAEKVRYYDMSIDEDTDFSAFIDGDSVSSYAIEPMRWMVQDSRQYIQGDKIGDDIAISPRGNATRAMMAAVLYRFRDTGDKLSEEFANPSEEFSAFPFWFWNDNLTEDEISRQMHAFKEKGIDGFVIHPRLGLTNNIVYMEESWMHYVRYAVELAKELNMKVILYDEAMYPSGSCRGQVVAENPEYASKGIRISTDPVSNPNEEKLITSFLRDGKTYYVIEAYSHGVIRGVYYGEDENDGGAKRSSDLLNPDAVATFIRLTHQKYYDELSEYFGDTIIAMFTDEPSLLGRRSRGNLIAWTDDLAEDMFAAGVTEEDLYYLFYDKNTQKGQKVNQIYNEVVYNRLKTAYYGQISKWCVDHGIALTGHPSSSMDIGLLSEFQIPCQDVVWRYVAPANAGVTEAGSGHETMGKCASDAARHNGQRRNGNECCGACSLTSSPRVFTRDDFKWYIDWLFARGCNFLIPHAFYYSVEGNRGNERPPQLGMNGMFWDDWDELSAYIKRCSAMNTDGVNITDIAVLCTKDKLSVNATNPMIQNQIEFNYLEENLLDKCTIENGHIKIANQSYRVLVLDGNYSAEAKEFINKFQSAGGTVINYSTYAGKISTYVQLLKDSSFTDLNLTANNMLRMTHIRKYGKDIVYFTNEGEDTISTTLNEKVDEVWNAETGNMMKNYSGDSYKLVLKPRESIYLILK